MRAMVVFGLACQLGGCAFEGGAAPGQSPDARVADAPPAADAPFDAPPEPSCIEPPANLVAWWDGEELGDDIVGEFDMDSTSGSPQVLAGLVGEATTIADGDWVTISPPPPVSTFTVEAWVKRTADDPDYQTIYGRECRGGFAGNPRAGLFLLEHRLTAWFASGGLCPGENLALSSAALAIDTWHHVAATFDGETIQLYVDGVADNSATESDFAFHPNTARIGGADIADDQNLVGQIDELAIYDRALTAAEISAIAQAAAAGKCKGEQE